MKDRYLTAVSFTETIYDLIGDEIKEVDYECEENYKILASWYFMGVDFKIVQYKKWVPCAYIKIPEHCRELRRVIISEWYDYVPHNTVHWWFTFGKLLAEWEREWLWEWLWLGWDYWHCDDYADYLKNVSFVKKLKRRTTKEILIEVIEQIITFYDEGVLY